MQKKYHEIMQINLPIYGVSTRILKDFLTSERDQLRQITKMPGQEYRLWEIDVVKEERKSGANSLDFDHNDDFYDDFVIVDRLDMKKYNKQSKLLEEEKIKDSGSSKCLVARNGMVNGSDSVTLEDFQIKKVIDKGSFGKVFLVVQKSTGQYYAMKRINKDILIDKNQIQNTKNEKEILFQSNHPFVLSMDYVF